MCGVGGVYNFNTADKVDISHINKMQSKLLHRGPDFQDTVEISQNNIMFHNRLSIIDLSKAANQPFISSRKSVLSFNGEIYNHEDLRLTHLKYETSSDTEVLLNGLDHSGVEFLNGIDGMYAFAYWNNDAKTLSLSRDHVGIKPLYYYLDEDKLVYASEIKSILEYSGVSRELDDDGIREYFKLGYIRCPNTGIKNIKQLFPGETIVFGEKGLISKIQRKKIEFKVTGNDWDKEFERVLSKSTRSHLVADVPVTVFLSGGLDSTAIAESLKNSGEYSVTTFVHNTGAFCEKDKAKLVANKLNKNLKEIELKKNEAISFRRIAYFADDLICDPALVSNYKLFNGVSKLQKVGVSGDGADELFLGYHTYFATILANSFFLKLTYPFLAILKYVLNLISFSHSKYPLVMLIEKFLDQKDKDFPFNHLMWRSPGIEDLLIENEEIKSEIIEVQSLKREMSELDIKTYLEGNILKKVDRMSMANSFEARVPYLSSEMISFSRALPMEHKMKFHRQKIILRRFLANKMYPKNIWKQKKMGFGVNLEEFIRNDHLEFLGLSHSTLERYIDKYKLTALLAKKSKNYVDYYKIYSVLMFKLWLEEIAESSS